MKSNIHFISGLPRSGSTLLAAILKQNPKFVASMTSPVSTIFRGLEDSMAQKVETSVFITEKQRDLILYGLFEKYYYEVWNKKVIFDTSRMWCARLSPITKLFPHAKIICCVRELSWVMDSFERIYRRNNQQPSGIYNYDTGGTVYSRSNSISSSNGIVGYSLDALREACASEQSNSLLIVEYENLCKNPETTINNIYNFIGEVPFNHNFDKVEYNAGEFDKQLGAIGLHDVTGKVEWRPRNTILPLDLFNRYSNDNFWKEIPK